MSKIEVQTIDAPSGQNTVTIGDSNASTITLKSGATLTNFPEQTPAFEAYLSADQSISDNTVTKAQFNTERFDTNSAYDNSSNYRFQPTVAGKYFVYANLQLQMGDYKIYVASTYIYKNGSEYALTNTTSNNNTIFAHPLTINATIDMNGSSDYIEIYGLLAAHGGSGQHFESSNKNSYFGAYRIIGA
jgi:hypothetical protein